MAATARTLQFAHGTTNTITNSFNVNGSVGVIMTIQSDTTAVATLLANIGIISCLYIEPIYITSSGTSAWVASQSTDGGNNTGWIFLKDVQMYVVSAWKQATVVQVRIAGVWKVVSKAQIRISGVWKSVF